MCVGVLWKSSNEGVSKFKKHQVLHLKYTKDTRELFFNLDNL